MSDEYLRFEANLPQDASMPVKPTKDMNTVTMRRRVRVWVDAWLEPGETEKLLLLSDETFHVVIVRRKGKPEGSASVVVAPFWEKTA